LLIVDDFKDSSFIVASQKDFEIFYISLLINPVDDRLQNNIDKMRLVFAMIELDIIHVDELVVDVFIFFVEINEFERTAQEKVVNLPFELKVEITFYLL